LHKEDRRFQGNSRYSFVGGMEVIRGKVCIGYAVCTPGATEGEGRKNEKDEDMVSTKAV